MATQTLTEPAKLPVSKSGPVVVPDTDPFDGYELTPEQAVFYKSQTGIDDDDDLKAHIIKLQERAYKIFPYLCIKWFIFLEPGVAALPEYKNIVQLARERPNEILLDVGCCFGQDARRAAADGFPLKNIVTTDLHQEFYELGHTLFNTTPETYPIKFLPGDVFDPNMLQVVPHFDKPPAAESLDVSTLTTLTPLHGRCAAIYAINFFHLFTKENQLYVARAMAGLLSPLPGSIICGEHTANWNKGIFDEPQHTPESWSAMWDGEAFPKGTVKVDARISRVVSKAGLPLTRLQWAVTKL